MREVPVKRHVALSKGNGAAPVIAENATSVGSPVVHLAELLQEGEDIVSSLQQQLNISLTEPNSKISEELPITLLLPTTRAD